ncbi:MAG: peptidase domain-containing ABC transporter [Muribaculaceae bacterium]|nr:peptidase domain-containing ABC transporter [Muribaculaceae bacterium]
MFKCYRQIEHSDCGLSCLKMIARHYGKEIPLRHLHGISELNRLGMSIRDIKECADKINMDSAAVRIRIENISNMPLPAILYWQQRHFVVLYNYDTKRGKYYIADPAQGKLKYSENDFSKYWLSEDNTGLAILFEPRESFNSQEFPKENSLKDFFSYLSGFFKVHKGKFLIALLISLAIMAADFSIPLLLKKTIDDGIGLKDVNLIVLLLLSQLAIAIGGLIASNGMNLVLTKTGLGIHLQMVNNFLERLAKFPLSFFDKKVSSDFVQKINDQTRIKDFLLSFPDSIVIISLTTIVFGYLLFKYSITIFSIFFIMSLLEIGWNALFLNRRKTIDYAYFTHSSENRNHAYELTNGMADLKVNNAETSKIEKWKKTQEEINKVTIKSIWLNYFQGGGHIVLTRIKDLTITGVGAIMVISGDISIGVLMSLGYITGRLSQPFSTISSSLNSLQEALLSYQRIDDVIHDESEFRGKIKFKNPSICFNNVSFRYAGTNSPFVIKDFNLKIKEGTVTALVGESGCGKSTLIKLMLGFYIPQVGTLSLSGYPISEIDNQDWLRHCGVVMQEARIFSGTILENISLSASCPDKVRAEKILETVGLRAFVNSLPMGIHTKIGVSGIEMSGGQKQRLMIARALYKNPDILFLDEATSSLDANNEKSIVDNISEFGKGKTIIIAAHRLSTVQNADKIIFIKDGRIAEQGTHQELINLKGEYWHLVKNQLQLSI